MLKCGGVNRYYLPPPGWLKEEEKEKWKERGRKREDILRGSTVIYEEAASNTCGGRGGAPPPIKPGEVGGEHPGERRSFRRGKRTSWWEVSSRCPTVPQQKPSKSVCVGLPE